MIAHFGMYPFAPLREAYEQWWDAVRALVPDAPPLDHEVGLQESWRRADLFLGQTCGWPLAAALRDDVSVVGAFDLTVPFAVGGHYRSVLVANKPFGIDHWRADPSTRCAVNNDDSLSGWISLQAAWGSVPPNVRFTGAHLLSVRAVAASEADVAMIDALSFELIAETDPVTAAKVHVVGHGPLVPTLPLITSRPNAHLVPVLRAAIAATMDDPALELVRQRLRIRGFVPCGHERYEPLLALPPVH